MSKKYQNWFPAHSDFGSPINYLSDTFNIEGVLTESSWTYLDSMQRVAEACDIVLPGHEPFIPRKIPNEWYFTDVTNTHPHESELEEYKRVRDRVRDEVIVGDPTTGRSKEWEILE
jgi:hypothetical protein